MMECHVRWASQFRADIKTGIPVRNHFIKLVCLDNANTAIDEKWIIRLWCSVDSIADRSRNSPNRYHDDDRQRWKEAREESSAS